VLAPADLHLCQGGGLEHLLLGAAELELVEKGHAHHHGHAHGEGGERQAQSQLHVVPPEPSR
jgi:hypothetical protein